MTDEHKIISEAELDALQKELARLTELVYRDELTGLLNRRGFMEEAERVFHLVSYGTSTMERRTGFQIPFSVIFLDVDNFKKLNDTHGHAAGDAALKTVADVLCTSLRAGDLHGRIGGEEFAVAIIGAGAPRSVAIAEKLRAALERAQFVWEDARIPLTASFGVCEYRTEQTLQELIDKADKAMYTAKQAGKNRVESFA